MPYPFQSNQHHHKDYASIYDGFRLSPLPILRSYEDQRILDGTQWELAIDYGIKKISTSGSNSYPGANNVDMLLDWEDTPVFDDFLHAFNLLLGGTKIQ